jgi:hypothetical protein
MSAVCPPQRPWGGGTGFEYFEYFELLRPNEKRDEGAIVEVGENLEVSTEMSGRLTERCSQNFELIVEGSEGGTKRKRKKPSGPRLMILSILHTGHPLVFQH